MCDEVIIKAAFFDIDGTLIDPGNHTIPSSAIEAILKIQENGIKVFVASGRQASDLDIVEGLDAIKWDGYVCCNGAAVYDSNRNLLNARYFKKEQVEALVKKCENEGLTVYLRCGDYGFAPLGIDHYMIEAHTFFDEPLPPYVHPYNGEENIMMALIYAPIDYNFESVSDVKGLQAFPNRSTYADVCLSEVSKKVGLEMIAKKFGFKREELLAFGDQSNDMSMIEYAGTGIAMGNGSQALKDIADYVTLDVDKNGIYYACEQLGLLD